MSLSQVIKLKKRAVERAEKSKQEHDEIKARVEAEISNNQKIISGAEKGKLEA